MTTQDLKDFIEYYDGTIKPEFDDDYKLYVGDHDILHQANKTIGRPDNRIVANLAHYIVETFNGYFIGVPPKIGFDDTSANEQLQDWLNQTSFVDKLSEVARLSDIYGRSFLFAYQDEESQTRVAFSDARNTFMVYDDTVVHNPIAFVRYSYTSDHELSGSVYYANSYSAFDDNAHYVDEKVNPFKAVPAVEFYDNEDRQSIFDNVKTLINGLDKALSQKANQSEYFDNAYLKMLGLELPEDEDGNPIVNLSDNQLIYSKDIDSKDADVDFLTKPDGDVIQEHLIDRLTDLSYQISMVANLNDVAFSGNSSGVALQYKLLPMKNLASNKERKFTESLRKMFEVIFGAGTVLKGDSSDKVKDLLFQFNRNLPINMADEATTAATLEGIVSKETQLKGLSIVDDPKAEIKRMQKEQVATMQNATKSKLDYTDDLNKPEEVK
ncbi:phage portal protein, SPP1 Gp6 [Lactobacillus selangorensis]|uniref:Phage portal protein, SPP1 Gp6 n=1 Tax=Lactobacillus selangorensis TaxID=81857 RepID=A0A0R2FKR8_9LACO|nr:phage portal protein [Lactobacillus selangorensis]KRN29225.1 phage portal protein, SPP1 Gp6 [Lactobacillus selangorensis]KRN31417.1 phage portal protein, SPP1 Gp6 [Lactobacillus selangorensis]